MYQINFVIIRMNTITLHGLDIELAMIALE